MSSSKQTQTLRQRNLIDFSGALAELRGAFFIPTWRLTTSSNAGAWKTLWIVSDNFTQNLESPSPSIKDAGNQAIHQYERFSKGDLSSKVEEYLLKTRAIVEELLP